MLNQFYAVMTAFFLALPVTACNEDERTNSGSWSVVVREIRTIGEGTDRAIVFVHGLGGHYRDTFYNKTGDTSWFDIVANDNSDLGYDRQLSSFDIYSIDYGASFDSDLSVSELVDQVVIAIDASGIFKKYDHLWFVTHSLGGIVTKQLLTSFKEENKDRYLEKIVGVSLLGVPSQGAPIAQVFEQIRSSFKIAALLNAIFGPRSKFIKDLQPSDVNTFLKDVEGSWPVSTTFGVGRVERIRGSIVPMKVRVFLPALRWFPSFSPTAPATADRFL